jgi:type II secretory pathway pseudopilin PulG
MQRLTPTWPIQRCEAYSMIELVVALGLTSILLGTAVLAWPRLDAAMQLDSGLYQIAADLHAAQTLAVASAGRVRVVFTMGSAHYRREHADDQGDYHLDVNRVLPRGIRVVDVNSGGDFIFSARGQAENGTITLGDRRGTHRMLRVNQRGRLTLLAVGGA